MPSARDACGSIRGTGVPATDSVPASGVSTPVMILMSVDLPAPFSPTRACTSPARRSNETPFSARTPANDFAISEVWRRGGMVSAGVWSGGEILAIFLSNRPRAYDNSRLVPDARLFAASSPGERRHSHVQHRRGLRGRGPRAAGGAALVAG